MSTKESQIKEHLEKAKRIKPGTPEMENLLAGAYGMDIEEAKRIIEERKANPAAHPYEDYKKAVALLAAYKATPQVIAVNKPGGEYFPKEERER